MSLLLQDSHPDDQSPRVSAGPLPAALCAFQQPADSDSADHGVRYMVDRGGGHFPETYWDLVLRRFVFL